MTRQRQGRKRVMASRHTDTEQVVPEIGSAGAVFTDDSMVKPRFTYTEIISNCACQPEISVTDRLAEHWTLTDKEENNSDDRGIPQRMLDAYFFILSLTARLNNVLENFTPSDKSLLSLGMHMERIRINEETSRTLTPPTTLPLTPSLVPWQPAPSLPPWPLEIESQQTQDNLVDHVIRRLKDIWPTENSGNVWSTDNVHNGCPVSNRTEELLELSGIRRTVRGSEEVQDTKTTDLALVPFTEAVIDYYRRRANRRPLFDCVVHTEERATKSKVVSLVPDVRSTVSQSANFHSTAPRHNDNRPYFVSYSPQVQCPPFHQNHQSINYTPVNTMPVVLPHNSTPISLRNNNFYYTNNTTPSVHLDTVLGPQQTNIYKPPPSYNYMGYNNNHAINNVYNYQDTWSPQMYTGWTSQPPWPRTQYLQPAMLVPDVRSTVPQSANFQSTAPRHNDNRPHFVSFFSQVQCPPFHQNHQSINYTPVNTMPVVIPRNFTPILWY